MPESASRGGGSAPGGGWYVWSGGGCGVSGPGVGGCGVSGPGGLPQCLVRYHPPCEQI